MAGLQYTAGEINGEELKGYLEEEGVAQDSQDSQILRILRFSGSSDSQIVTSSEFSDSQNFQNPGLFLVNSGLKFRGHFGGAKNRTLLWVNRPETGAFLGSVVPLLKCPLFWASPR